MRCKEENQALESLAEALDELLDFEKLKYCFECGICTASCPVAELFPGQYNPRTLLHSLPQGKDETLDSAELWLCAWCYRCYRRCPQSLKLPEIFQVVRRFAAEHGRVEGFGKALEMIRGSIPIPASCCHVCFHPERAIEDDQLVSDTIQHAVFDYEANKRKPARRKRPRKGTEKVAVIGSGPAGLSAAQDLAKKGYSVTIFEAQSHPGGMLRRCIPKYRLPRSVLDLETERMKEAGIAFKTGTAIGKDVAIDKLLQKGFKAVFVATGAHEERRLRIEGERLDNVFHALTFLESANTEDDVELGDRVSVIGGGDVAVDSARTALKLGAKEVTILYRRSRDEMPANPWETKEAEEEGVGIKFLVAPIRITGENGKSTKIECIRLELGELDNTGRRRPVPIQGSEFTVETDAVIVAIGQAPNLAFLPEGVEVTRRRTIAVSPFTSETSL
ncbi:MAG: FAD-dependent oxidoreductase, partial [Candidatus Bathyarchaeota archaeon]|nr:FAD-dependent oxidoreductase [Candidatus Bathyarchaeota archaeon]